MKTRKIFLSILLILAMIIPVMPATNNHVHADEWEQCSHCGSYRSPDYLCDTCGGCNINCNNDCFLEYHCPCGNCELDIPICPDCRQCLDCVSGDVMCMNCGKCEECGGRICPDCQFCVDCVGLDLYCTDCGKCANCVADTGGYCFECELCAECTEMCTSDDCSFCENCSGNVCDNCGKCAFCVHDQFCDCCNMCIDCNGPFCNGCNYCSETGTVCKGCGDYCSSCDNVCLDCEECEACIGLPICPNCGICSDCSGTSQCLDCDWCSDCANICEDCGEVCDEHAKFCLDCDRCENCVHLCHDCRDHCFECNNYCHDCESCEECVNLCENCEEVCDGCANFCLDCNKCEDCVEVCEACGEYCHDCANFCPDCNRCENCVNLCDGCGKVCEDCAKSCKSCGVCENCVSLCAECGHYCENCEPPFCQGCKSGSCCGTVCPTCEESCSTCQTDWAYKSINDDEHQLQCSCGGFVREPESHRFGYVVKKHPTATEDGIGELKCSGCDYIKETVIIPATNGEEHIHDFSLWVTTPYSHYKYCACGVEDSSSQGSHEFKTVIDIEPTPEDYGLKHEECTICGYKSPGEKINPIGHVHNYGTNWKSNAYHHWRECDCGDMVDKDSHSMGEWVVTLEPTETQPGSKERTCTVCAYKHVIAIKPLGEIATYKVTINGNAIESEDYTITGADNLETVAEGTKLKIIAVKDITVDGGNLGIGKTKSITIYKARTITINKAIGTCPGCGSDLNDSLNTCLECNRCENCVSLCDGCKDVCEDCAKFCTGCGVCENCVSLCAECGYYCENCEPPFCEACKAGSCCGQVCPDCKESCSTCQTDWIYKSINDKQHQLQCSCGGFVRNAEIHILKYVVIKPATGTVDGIGELRCIDCDYVKETVAIPATNGEEHIHDFSLWVTNPYFHCKYCACGKDLSSSQGTHEFKTVIDIEPTTEDYGLQHKECTICGYKSPGEKINPIGHVHDYGAIWKSNAYHHWSECECGDMVDKDPHSMGEWVITLAPTEAQPGSRERTCTVCGYRHFIGIQPLGEIATYKVTIDGNAIEGTDYTITGADILETVAEGTNLRIRALKDITVNGEKVVASGIKVITINEDKTITINKCVEDPPVTKYTVTFKDYDGTVLKTEEVEEENAGTAPENPTRDGYTFTGWDKGYTNVTSDLIVTATYTKDGIPVNKYTVTFKDHDGTVLKTEEVEKGNAGTAPENPTREGYTFIGWDVAFDNVTGNLTVIAQYVEDGVTTYAVTIAGDAAETTDYTIAGATDLTALEGEVTLTITAVTDITVNAVKVAKDATRAIVVNNPTTITINKYAASSGGGGSSSSSSTITTYTIKTSAGKGGIIDADKTVSVRSGRNVEFEIKADEGYEIEDVKVDGKSVGAVSSYEFKRVRADHTISATFKKIEVIEPEEDKKDDFIDVPANEWYYDPIMKATDKGWFSGTSDTTFSPNVAMSRGMIVTVLWRMENEPVSNVNSFADVMANNYYTTAVNWASEKGIVTGYGNDLFGPNDSITREQMASILYRYAQYKGYDTTQGGMAIREFLDYEDISEYALPPLAWGVNTGLMQGANNKLMPKDSATRAQVATILVRFSETIVK